MNDISAHFNFFPVYIYQITDCLKCIKRNSYGAVNAVTSAQLSLAGIKSAIAPDDVVDSMRRIGNQLPASLKETSCGGLATTESAQNYLNN